MELKVALGGVQNCLQVKRVQESIQWNRKELREVLINMIKEGKRIHSMELKVEA